MELFCVYREQNTIKIAQGDENMPELLYKKVGALKIGTSPFKSKEQAELYRQRWQTNVDLDPTCKPPYSIDKD